MKKTRKTLHQKRLFLGRVLQRSVILFLLTFTFHLNVFASAQSKINLNCAQIPVKEIFKEIERQSGLNFFYNEKTFPGDRKVTIKVTNADLVFVLNILSKDLFTYEIDNNRIIVNALLQKTAAESRKKMKLYGTVTDSDKEPLPGATVTLKGNVNNGCITDIDGKFSMEIAISPKDMLLVAFMGMKTAEITPVAGRPLDVVLEVDGVLMDEVVVTGYQKIDRRLFTGSADQVNAADAKLGGIVDIGSMLEGKSAGVSVQTVSGTFGTAPKIKVRGSSSIYGDQKPLWVVDGVVLEDVVDISADDLSSGDANTLISSAVSGLNSDDIENFQILKDASATALYGARAMNGVIVVTTKKGRTGSVRVNYTGEFSMRMKPMYSDYNIMNSKEQMSVYRELESKGWLNHAEISRQKNGGVYKKMYDLINTYNSETGAFGLENTPEARAKFLQKYERGNTDWFGELFRNNVTQNHSVSLSGGNDKSDFYFSTSYYGDSGWSVADKVDRFTINANANVKLFERLNLRFTTAGSYRDQRAPGTVNRVEDPLMGEYSRDFDVNPFSYALNTSRVLRPYDENGDYEYYRMNYADFNIMNEIKNNYIDIDMLDLKMQANIDLNIIKGLDFNAIGSVRYVKSTQEHRIMENSNMAEAYRANDTYEIAKNNKYLFMDMENPNSLPYVVLPKGGFYNVTNNNLVNYYFRTSFNYNKTFKDTHIMNIMGGTEIKSTNRQNNYFDGVGYQWNRGGIPYIDPNYIVKQLQSGQSYYGMGEYYDRYAAFFATGSYSYKGIYVLNGTFRYDGSNQLGSSKSARWLPTWNVSAAWNLSSEPFMEGARSVISHLSLRGTYGLTASMGPARNSSIVLMNQITDRPYLSEKETQMFIAALENSELTWEKQYETNIGFDLGLLNNRINLSTDLYWRNGFDLIGWVKTSGIGGSYSKLANYADMKSNGVEFTLTTHNFKGKDFTWTTNLTFSYNHNKITNLASYPQIIDLLRDTGGPLEGYPVRGLFSIDYQGLNSEGIPTFINEKGEHTVTDIDFQSQEYKHLKYEGSVDPKYTGGFGNTLSYKNWKFNVFLTYQFGNVVRLYPEFKAMYSDLDAMPKEFFDRWKFAGDESKTDIPTILSYNQYMGNYQKTYNAYNMSSARVADGSFIRLKEISLSYDLPKDFLGKIKIPSASLKLQATNLFLLYSDKKLNGQDPEFIGAGGVAMPVPRQVTLTLKVGF